MFNTLNIYSFILFFPKNRETEEPVTETEKDAEVEKQVAQEEVGDANKKDNAANEPEEKEPEDKVKFLVQKYYVYVSNLIQTPNNGLVRMSFLCGVEGLLMDKHSKKHLQ